LLERAIDLLRNNPSRVAQQAIETGTGAVGSALGLLGAAGSFLFGLFLTVFFFFFFADRWSSVVRFAQSLLPDKNRERALELASKMNRAIAGFVRGRLIIGLILAGFYTIGFAFMGVPAPLLLGFAIAALALIPYAVIAGMPVVILLLWLESHSGFRGEVWWIIGAPIAYYNIGQLLDDYLLTPVIQGKATDLATPEIVFASVAAGTLFGIFGLLVAIPLAACLKILIVEVAWPKYKAWSEGKRPDALPLE
jgi:predicted PurR-regulated permease PerM